ncbi:hypothetical protein EUTSA_v10009344mg [Eutrema salsugineum]|uniref:F-box domain-containing protein n=1 Tax=Eutrema salsugineum TaxID=72664 RepID=V4L2T1_EUTSA|nr:hypothetical protein EUTSA_v10009344mg [Eutrema salsugineum]
MDQKEKTGKIKRARHDDDDDARCQPDHIPLDLTLEILSRLPAKSILRSQCVSKLWSSFTTLPSFVSSFASRSSSRPPSLLIWNPSLRRFSTLPHPTHSHDDNWISYLGFDPLEGKHKVLCVSHKDSQQPRVLTLGAQYQSWRIISKGVPRHCPLSGDHGQCFNGILYYKARAIGVNDHPIIMSFDVKSENVWRTRMRFQGISDAGELIFAPYSVFKSFYILYFDPRKNSSREALFERIVGEEFRHRYGLSNNYSFITSVSPNHFESLMSLS